MGAIQLASLLTEPLEPAPMSVVPEATPGLGACCLLIAADLFKRRGAAVSVNVLPEQVLEEELGQVIRVDHAPRRRVKRYNEKTDQALVADLLRKVQESHPAATMMWNEDEASWYIRAPKPKPAAITLSPPPHLASDKWVSL